uniref:Uncharacterized protein n=1 Tax=Anguilla anguilla TaxID=7936 RepID=A0A0E9TGZ9_ANGAN
MNSQKCAELSLYH